MKEECKLCSVGWGGATQTTDFSISSLMRPAAVPHAGHGALPQLDPRQDAVLLSAYLFKLGYYQPAGPMIKESSADAERALARYHPPHYHAPHPPVLQQYGPPYYTPELCYGRYYRPPGPYHMPPQPDAQMVGVGSEPYPPPPYYGTPPCYQHSPQRIPYVEYRGCPCPLNACPKNVLIGPATGKAPTGGGPDVVSALAPPGGAFRAKVRACALDAVADTHGSGKDPPLEPEPPAAADAPHPCPLPAIGGASPKRELLEGMALAGGPPSPARGSAGACAPQPPPPPSAQHPAPQPAPLSAPRRARLGKDMARRRYGLHDTAQLLQPRPDAHEPHDDDVLAVSPPAPAPIDLSASDDREPPLPLVDVKKENEGPLCASSASSAPARKPDALALREHNSSSVQEAAEPLETAKPVKRRFSRPKLEIDMKDTQLEESCKTNGIGEHVKLQKRRKVSGDQTVARVETVTKEPKKKSQAKKPPKTPNSEKKALKRKVENGSSTAKAKRMLLESSPAGDPRLKNVAAVTEEINVKPKIKSALLLDNLIRKNSIDRVDSKGYTSDKELNPAELFLTPDENVSQNSTKKTLNINNNIVENSAPIGGVRPNTIAAVTQLMEKKFACKTLETVDSKITHSLKTVLKSPTDKLKLTEDSLPSSAKCKTKTEKNSVSADSSNNRCFETDKDMLCDSKAYVKDSISVSNKNGFMVDDDLKSTKSSKVPKPKASSKDESKIKLADESQNNLNNIIEAPEDKTGDATNPSSGDVPAVENKAEKAKRNKVNGQMKNKSIENVAKLLVSKKPATADANDLRDENGEGANRLVESLISKIAEKERADATLKRNKATGEIKAKSIERVAKLLGSKRADEDEAPPAAALAADGVAAPLAEAASEPPSADRAPPKRCKLTSGDAKEEKKKKVVKLLVSKKPAIKTDEAALVVEDACAGVGGRRAGRGRRRRPPPPPPPPVPPHRAPPRWSNGWRWHGEHYLAKVYLNNDSRLDRTARCWARMRHASGDCVSRGDCVLLRASAGKAQQPFVAKVASLWENPEDGEMMVSLVWYYRPEHTERGREPEDAPDEVFASRHRDANSVACIEDKCYVLTFNEYCRYRKRLKAAEEGVVPRASIVPPLPGAGAGGVGGEPSGDARLPAAVSPELVLFCRKIYDFRSKKIQAPSK